MFEEKYDEAIEKMKDAYPHLRDARFAIEDGTLIWHYDSRYKVDVGELQKFVNEVLGQEEYMVEFTGHVKVYARSKEEAESFSKHEMPKVFARSAKQIS